MKLFVLAVRDRAAGQYQPPFVSPAIGVAVRSFGDEINRQAQDNPLYLHPSDFSLHHLGGFDNETGEFSLLEKPLPVADGKTLSTAS